MGGLGVTFFISMLLEFNGAAPNHFHMMGGDCTQVWKTLDLGTRRTPKCPAHSRHNKNNGNKKAPATRYRRLCVQIKVGLAHPFADFAATREGLRRG